MLAISGFPFERDNIKRRFRPVLQKTLDVDSLKPYLMSQVENISADAIVRIKANCQVNAEIRQLLTSQFLRDVFPRTMNVQLGFEFRNRYIG